MTVPRLMCQVDDPGADQHRHAGHLIDHDGADRGGDGGGDRRAPMLLVWISTCDQRSSRHNGDVLFISLDGELDVFSARCVAAGIDEVVACARDVVIDVANVGFIDAAGVALLQSVIDQVAMRDGMVWLHDPCAQVCKVLDLAAITGELRCSSRRHDNGYDDVSCPPVVGRDGPIDRQVLIHAVF